MDPREQPMGIYKRTKAHNPLTAGTVQKDATTCLPLSTAGPAL